MLVCFVAVELYDSRVMNNIVLRFAGFRVERITNKISPGNGFRECMYCIVTNVNIETRCIYSFTQETLLHAYGTCYFSNFVLLQLIVLTMNKLRQYDTSYVTKFNCFYITSIGSVLLKKKILYCF